MNTLRGVSSRMAQTDVPCIVQMQQMLRGKSDILSLAQGIVHWPPPEAALAAGRNAMSEADTSLYGADDGMPALRAALVEKLRVDNGLTGSDVMVTAGANQAYTNVVLTLMDARDSVLLYRPYYFNHLMAHQMTGSASQLVLPNAGVDLQPDLGALRAELEGRAERGEAQLAMVTLCNPGNPTGVMIPRATLEEASDLCRSHGVWLVVDNTYEHFAYDGEAAHECIEGEHIVNIFSFSKAYGMMGWRVGYIAHPPSLGTELLKAQDTIAICPSIASQKVALGALSPGRAWVSERVAGLGEQKRLVLDALAPLGSGAVKGGSGAIYLFCKLKGMLRCATPANPCAAATAYATHPRHRSARAAPPPSRDWAPLSLPMLRPGIEDDMAAVRYLVEEHGVCLIPGSACGMPGHVRVCYANLPLEKTREAAKRLRAGLEALSSNAVDLSAYAAPPAADGHASSKRPRPK